MNFLKTRSGWIALAAVCIAAWAGVAEPSEPSEPSAAPRASAAAWNADLPAVSDGLHVWLWTHHTDPKDEDQQQLTLFHADATHRPPKGPAWEKVTTVRGWLAPQGAAADDDTLWLIFDAGAVQRVNLQRGPIEDQWYFDQAPAMTLPADTTVRATTAAHGKLWVLARVENQTALEKLDREFATPRQTHEPAPDAEGEVDADSDAELLSLALGLPRGMALPGAPESAQEPTPSDPEATPDTDTDTGIDADAEPEAGERDSPSDVTSTDAAETSALEKTESEASDTPPAAPSDRLLVLHQGRWRVVPLPEGWASNRPTRLVAPPDPEGLPDLLVQPPSAGSQTRVMLYRTDAAWTPHRPGAEIKNSSSTIDWSSTTLDLPGPGDVAALRVSKQLMLVQHTPVAEGFAAGLWAVRGEALTPIGGVALDSSSATPANGRWAAVNFGEAVGVLAGPRHVDKDVMRRTTDGGGDLPAPGPTLTAIDLQGQTTLPPMTMAVEAEHPIAEAADYIILLGVVTMSTILLFTFWRRDPTANQLSLPDDLALSDLMRRGLAGLIDLTPGLLVATAAFDLPLGEVYARWPGRGQGATGDLMVPGLTAIGVVVAHTALLEIFTGRSLGKFATGLRVTTLTGDRPKAWQLLTRCLLKAFDLVAYLLLILPIISPYRQRLGDMVARTVVVTKAPPPENDPAKADGDRDGGAA